MPDGEKDLLLAFTQRNQLNLPDFDDLSEGKGIIILLCGPPGVGKTLTAESVAERSRVPLYTLRASDLGTNPALVEKTLNSALECCRLWNAILLIDEADVFMEKRSSERLAQNEHVSSKFTHGRLKGVMFLATNQANTIDPAFRSHIDLILPYPDLTRESREQIWRAFLETILLAHSFSDEHFNELADADLNGRDIKNVVKIARFAAGSRGVLLGMEHLRTIIGIKERAALATRT
ncbi:P-loop containing nucleoside triphosphate hydrolase protein [Macrophomina phaseolina]|uniref:P-loop containing nucleoside triphosphate hydrolase protein n=1 Tax=Macrophomina phaseolina TaxID=35725 RepID=A0ABQ8GQX9_9PEZI|nr:P-loop containing nucleoside triphosphate hydrolase protein [Macrophomina phaseolina]